MLADFKYLNNLVTALSSLSFFVYKNVTVLINSVELNFFFIDLDSKCTCNTLHVNKALIKE